MKTPEEIAEYYYSLHCDDTLDEEKHWIIPAMIGAMKEYAKQDRRIVILGTGQDTQEIIYRHLMWQRDNVVLCDKPKNVEQDAIDMLYNRHIDPIPIPIELSSELKDRIKMRSDILKSIENLSGIPKELLGPSDDEMIRLRDPFPKSGQELRRERRKHKRKNK